MSVLNAGGIGGAAQSAPVFSVGYTRGRSPPAPPADAPPVPPGLPPLPGSPPVVPDAPPPPGEPPVGREPPVAVAPPAPTSPPFPPESRPPDPGEVPPVEARPPLEVPPVAEDDPPIETPPVEGGPFMDPFSVDPPPEHASAPSDPSAKKCALSTLRLRENSVSTIRPLIIGWGPCRFISVDAVQGGRRIRHGRRSIC